MLNSAHTAPMAARPHKMEPRQRSDARDRQGNDLHPSTIAAGADQDDLPASDPGTLRFGRGAKAWRAIWRCGQDIALIDAVLRTAALIGRLEAEYRAALTAINHRAR